MLNFIKQLSLGLIALFFLLYANVCVATNKNKIDLTAPDKNTNAAFDRRIQEEVLAEENLFAITFYKQNYLLPYYYTASPYNQIYKNYIPANERIKNSEVKFQLSFKVPLWKKILGSNSHLYIAYTQLSYWQAFNKHAFFRETDYQPELFINNELCIPILSSWKVSAINIGAVHESNGFGNPLERSWNKVYIEAITTINNFMLTVKTWYVFNDATYRKFNPNMANYLGYGELTMSYKIHYHTFTLQTHSLIENGGRHATVIAGYSFPLNCYLNAFVQIFSGYGQSLIEYNRRTNSLGIGIAFNNLI